MDEIYIKREELAQLFGITDDRLNQLYTDGTVVKPQRNQYAVFESTKRYIQYIKDGNRPDSDIEEEKLLTARVKRQLEELKLKQLEGELLKKDDVDKEWFETGKVIRDKMLTIPSKMSDITEEQQTLLEGMIRECLEELSA